MPSTGNAILPQRTRASQRAFALARGPVPFANRADVAQPTLSSGGSLQGTYRAPCVAAFDVTAVQITWTNRQFSSTSGEIANPDAYTLKASLELSDGTLYPIYFSGAREALVASGADITSDVIPVKLRAGDTFYIRSRPLAGTLGHKWPTAGGSLGGSTTPAAGGYAGSDQVDTAGFAWAATGTVAFGPSAIKGIPSDVQAPSAIVLGDSTAYGSGDGVNVTGDYGFIARLLTGAGIPYLKMATPGMAWDDHAGTSIADMLTKTHYLRSYLSAHKPDFAVVSLGNNDLHAATDLAACKVLCLRYLDLLEALGLPVVYCTVTPRTTTSNAWATLAGQTVNANNGKRRAFNDWLRSRPHSTIIDIWDVASLAEAVYDRAKFSVEGGAWTNDGTHLNTNGHSQVSTNEQLQGQALSLRM
jgi:lysophospholipase L1-like esterase